VDDQENDHRVAISSPKGEKSCSSIQGANVDARCQRLSPWAERMTKDHSKEYNSLAVTMAYSILSTLATNECAARNTECT